MQKIIYTSPFKIEWDAQSAFKITNYYTNAEEHMIFCYLKQYVHNGNLKLCTYCFDKEACGTDDLRLCFNLNPEIYAGCISMDFGVDGISSITFSDGNSMSEICNPEISYHSFRSNDQQGYYWCGEITLTKEFIKKHFDTSLQEKSIILLNFYKLFPGSNDYACLFPDEKNDILAASDSMQEFVVLNY